MRGDSGADAAVARSGVSRQVGLGLIAAVTSAAAFGTSGSFARPLLEAGWTAATVVALRLGLAAIVLAVPAALALRGRWGLVLQRWRPIVAYGVFGGAAAQVGYFNAVRYLPVALALLMEYLGIVLVVLWVWLARRRRPGLVTAAGMVVAITGLVVVIGPGSGALDVRGLTWAMLSAVGLAAYFVLSAETAGIPPVVVVSGGLAVGAAAVGVCGVVGLVPLGIGDAVVVMLGAALPWWVPLLELALVAAAIAYVLGFVGARRLGPTVASFVGLTEVLFSTAWAALLLGELPGGGQLIGGLVLLAGVAAVQWGTSRDALT